MFRRIFMNKAMLIEAMANITGFSKTECKEALEAAIATIETQLKKGEEVSIAGFGSFVTVDRKPRRGVNPATGKPMSIPAKRVPKFKFGKPFKELVKNSSAAKSAAKPAAKPAR